MDCRGAPLPPFMVMEKGESLIDWTTRSYPDLFQGIAVLLHVALRLRDMHQDGFVHRDIKPGNIMFLPRKNSWTVIDFGCTGRTGEPSPLSFTVQYAPPEVIAAYLSKDKTIIATEAMDAWALGVVSFELLTGGTAFPVGTHSKQVRSLLSCMLFLARLVSRCWPQGCHCGGSTLVCQVLDSSVLVLKRIDVP